METRFPTTEFRKHFRQLIKFNKEYIKECEITPDISPFDVSDVDEYYKRIEQWDTSQLRWKINRCKIASSVKGIYEDMFRNEFRENIPRNFLHRKDDTLNDYKARCKIALKELKTAERVILQGAALPEPRRRYGYQIELDTGLRGFDEKDAEIIKEGCKFLLENKGVGYIKDEVCPIALDNALALHYEINRRNIEKGFYDMDIKSGVIVRDIERNCLNFPLIKDIPYIKNGKEILKLQVQVSQEPDSSGRVGRINVFKPIKHELFKRFIGIPSRKTAERQVWNSLTITEQEILNNAISIRNKKFTSKIDYDNLSPGFQAFLHDLTLESERKRLAYFMVGSETCVWAQKTRPAAKIAEESIEISEAEYDAKDPLELAEITERFMESLERMERGIIDAHPRQDLFDSAVSTFEAWVEYDFDPNVIEPMLANILYNHIGKIDPRLVSRNLLLLVEDQVERGYKQWDWISAWLDKFDIVRGTLSVGDWRYITKLTEKSIIYFLPTRDIDALINDYGNIDPENKKARMIEIRKEFLNIDKFYDNIENLLLTDEVFNKKWKRFIKMPFTKPIIYGHTITELTELKNLISSITFESIIQQKEWEERTPNEEWIDSFIEARDNDEIKSREKIVVGLAKNTFVQESGGYMYVGVEDHFGNEWTGFWTSDPAEWFGGDLVRERWDEMTQKEQIQWGIDNTTYTEIEIKVFAEKQLENVLERIFMEAFYWKKMPCWDDENSEWDETCILDSTSQYLGDFEWKLK